MARTIFLYITKNFLRCFVGVSVALSSIILLFDFAELIRKTSGKSFISFKFVIQIILFKLPTLIQDLFPFIILFSAILTLWRLNRSNEITIMRTAGMSIYQIIKPLIFCTLFIGIFNLTIIGPLAANLMLRYERLYDYHFKPQQGNVAISESGLWLREFVGGIHTVYHIQNIDLKNDLLLNTTIYQFDAQDRFLKRIDVKKAFFTHGTVQCEKVWIAMPEQPPQFMDHYALSSTISFDDLQNQGVDPKSLSFWAIPKYIDLLNQSGLSGVRYQLHWHSLIARSIWLSVMIVFAASCALRPIRRGKTFNMIVNGILLTFFLYFLQDIMYALGNADKIPIIMAAWSPVLISGFISFAVLLHFEEGT